MIHMSTVAAKKKMERGISHATANEPLVSAARCAVQVSCILSLVFILSIAVTYYIYIELQTIHQLCFHNHREGPY